MVGLESIGTHEAFAHFAHLVFGLRFFIHFGTRRHKRNSNSVSQCRTGLGRNGASQEVIKTVPANIEFAGFCRAVNYGVVERYENLIQMRIARLAEQPCTHVNGRDFAFKFKLLTNGGRNALGRKKPHIRRPSALVRPYRLSYLQIELPCRWCPIRPRQTRNEKRDRRSIHHRSRHPVIVRALAPGRLGNRKNHDIRHNLRDTTSSDKSRRYHI